VFDKLGDVDEGKVLDNKKKGAQHVAKKVTSSLSPEKIKQELAIKVKCIVLMFVFLTLLI